MYLNHEINPFHSSDCKLVYIQQPITLPFYKRRRQGDYTVLHGRILCYKLYLSFVKTYGNSEGANVFNSWDTVHSKCCPGVSPVTASGLCGKDTAKEIHKKACTFYGLLRPKLELVLLYTKDQQKHHPSTMLWGLHLCRHWKNCRGIINAAKAIEILEEILLPSTTFPIIKQCLLCIS